MASPHLCDCVRDVARVLAGVIAVSGCSTTGSLPPIHGGAGAQPVRAGLVTQSAAAAGRNRQSADFVYVSDRSDAGTSRLLVYPANVEDPSPLRAITQGLVDVAGIAVDGAGDVFVANGEGGDVLEFAPGATSLIQTYSQGLRDPVDVAVANQTLYVADRGNQENGFAQQVIEYAIGNGQPTQNIAGLGNPPELNEAIAVDPCASQGTFFAAATTLSKIPPDRRVTGSGSYVVAQNVLPTLWMVVPLVRNEQVNGIAFDGSGRMFVSDVSANDVNVYTDTNYVWTYSYTLAGPFDDPLFLTINGDFLAIPNAGIIGSDSHGYVTVMDLTGHSPTFTLTKGLAHPVGAAASSSANDREGPSC